MPELPTHPSRDELNAYCRGQLSEDEAVIIDGHVNDCETCCETMLGLTAEDTFTGLLRDAMDLPAQSAVDVLTVDLQAGRVAEDSPAPNAIPDQLVDHPRYKILGWIGRGGMGDVFKAEHRKMERVVALKVINRNLVQSQRVVDRFHREVKTAAQLSHPNIVTAYDADQSGECHFMVMEYVDGIDLAKSVRRRGPLPISEACHAIRQVALGLHEAHRCGMVHRDIKPHNLVVTAEGYRQDS